MADLPVNSAAMQPSFASIDRMSAPRAASLLAVRSLLLALLP